VRFRVSDTCLLHSGLPFGAICAPYDTHIVVLAEPLGQFVMILWDDVEGVVWHALTLQHLATIWGQTTIFWAQPSASLS